MAAVWRALRRRTVGVWRWCAEVGGIAMITAGAWWRVDPLAGLLIAGTYLVILANARSEGGGE